MKSLIWNILPSYTCTYCGDSICIFNTYGSIGGNVFGNDLYRQYTIILYIFKLITHETPNICFSHYFFGWFESLNVTNSAADDVNRTFCPKRRAKLRIEIISFRINISNFSWISFCFEWDNVSYNTYPNFELFIFSPVITVHWLTILITKISFKYKFVRNIQKVCKCISVHCKIKKKNTHTIDSIDSIHTILVFILSQTQLVNQSALSKTKTFDTNKIFFS